MKRTKFLCLSACLILSFCLVSCAPAATTLASASTASLQTAFDQTAQQTEIANLQKALKDMSFEKSSLTARIENLEQNLKDATKVSPQLSNYTIEDLLTKSYMDHSQVDMFPGILKSIRLKTLADGNYFIFTIDRLQVNPDWDGPAAAGEEGFFINSEEKFEEYQGFISTIFEFKGYETFEEKQAAVLAHYGNGEIYNFYMIGDEIVCVGPDPGP